MNTTNKKTSLYDSVKKNDRINMERKNIKNSLHTIPRGKILTIMDKFGEIVAIFIHGGIVEGSGFFNPIIAYIPFVGWLKRCPSFKLDEIGSISYALPEEKEVLFEIMKKEGYIWDGWNVILGESAEDKEDEVADVDKSPAEEETIVPSDKKKCIIDKVIENKIAHNIKVAKDILDNTLPYYVINENIEGFIRTTDKSLKRDINNFNYFTNKKDVDEAIRRVKETLMNFQEEIQNRK